jgi:hypothetical protein
MKKRKIKLLFFVLFLFGAPQCSQVKPIKVEVFIFPQNFKGVALVFLGIESGLRDSISNDTIYYILPEDGVLFSQGHSHITNMSLSRYYYKDSIAVLTEIFKGTDKTGAGNNRIWVDNTGGNNSFGDYKSYNYLVVSGRDSNEYRYVDFNRYADSVIAEKLKQN